MDPSEIAVNQQYVAVRKRLSGTPVISFMNIRFSDNGRAIFVRDISMNDQWYRTSDFDLLYEVLDTVTEK